VQEDVSKPRFKQAPQIPWSILSNLIMGKIKKLNSASAGSTSHTDSRSRRRSIDNKDQEHEGNRKSNSNSKHTSDSECMSKRSSKSTSPSTCEGVLARSSPPASANASSSPSSCKRSSLSPLSLSLPFSHSKKSATVKETLPQLVISEEVPAFLGEVARVRSRLSTSNGKLFGQLVSSLRDMLHWKEEIHVIYTHNLYFLRQVVVEGMLRTDLAEVGGLEWVGNGAAGTLSENHPVWFLDFVELGKLFQAPMQRVGMNVQRAQQVLMLFTKARCMRDMYRGFTPPPHIGRGRRVKVGASG
jgi:hypothetical protein